VLFNNETFSKNNMTFNNYFDEEYFHIQEFLNVLSDTLPIIDLDEIPVLLQNYPFSPYLGYKCID